MLATCLSKNHIQHCKQFYILYIFQLCHLQLVYHTTNHLHFLAFLMHLDRMFLNLKVQKICWSGIQVPASVRLPTKLSGQARGAESTKFFKLRPGSRNFTVKSLPCFRVVVTAATAKTAVQIKINLI